MMTKNYVSPEVEIIEVVLEKGFAISINPDDEGDAA